MSASIVLTLDTTGPDVTFGAVGGNTAGELLQVAYTSSEPVADATLVRSGRRLVLTVWSDRLEGLIPVDWLDGPSDIEVADDVGNVTAYAAAVAISSPITGPAPAPAGYGSSHSTFGTAPTRRRSPPLPSLRDVGRTTTVALRSRADVTAASATPTVVAIGSLSATSSTVSRVQPVETFAGGYTAASVTTTATVVASGVAAVTKRDGPDLEDVILLGLIS